MKKILALVLATVMIVSLSACGAKEEPLTGDPTLSDNIVDTPTSSDTVDTSTSDGADWRQFLRDYEAWVDDYIEIAKKYKDNPTDMSILSDYTEMASEMAEWADQADEIEMDIKDTDEALEYSMEVLRIAGKLAEAAY